MFIWLIRVIRLISFLFYLSYQCHVFFILKKGGSKRNKILWEQGMLSHKVGLIKWLENVVCIYIYILYIYVYIYIYSSSKVSLLAFQRVLNDSCEPEH